MKRIILALTLSLALAGCANLQGIYSLATTATVPASEVVIAANSFDALKATAINYAGACVSQHFPQPVCSAANRRAVIKAVNSGTAARNALESSMTSGQPALSTAYNTLISAVNVLTASPINTVKGS
jgi:hypothetical protein